MPALNGSDFTIVQDAGAGRFNLVEIKTGRVVVSMLLRSVSVDLSPNDFATASADFIIVSDVDKGEA